MSLSLKERVADLTAAQRKRWFKKLPRPMQQSIVMRTAWWFEGRPEQQTPPGKWRFWLICAGRGFGKTRTGAEWAAEKARRYPGARIALVAPTFADGRDTMVEGESGLLSVLHPSELRGGGAGPAWNRSMGELFLANGSRFKIFSSERPKRLRGPQHHFCHPAGTMVQTPAGPVPIESLREGDLVDTRRGPRRITGAGARVTDELTVLWHGNNRMVTTPDHPVWIEQRGWVEAGEVHPGDRVLAWTDDRVRQTVFGPWRRRGTSTGTPTTPSFTSSGRCGSGVTGRFRRAAKSITATMIAVTTALRTWKSSPADPTTSCTAPTGRWWRARGAQTPLKRSRTGVPVNTATAAAGCERTSRMPEHGHGRGRVDESLSIGPASTAVGCSNPSVAPASVRSAASISAPGTLVYNLTVDGEHEYFANNTLVHNCWGDEPAYWDDVEAGTAKDSTFSNLNIGLRLPPIPGWDRGYRPQGIFTTTPRRVPLLKMPDELVKERPELAGLLQRKDVIVTTGSTMDNIDNLDETYKEAVVDPLIGTTLGVQELGGIMLEDVEGALWSTALINADRLPTGTGITKLRRTVVSFDPAGGEGYGHDEHGIMVIGSAGARRDQHFYLLADRSANCTPNEAARRALLACLEFGAAAIVFEKNQGQDWIPTVFQAVWDTMTTRKADGSIELAEYEGQPRPRMEPVSAVKNKRERATPVAMLSQQHRTHMVGMYPILENQLTTWVPDEGLASPDRLDAYVWGITWLYEHGPGTADVASAATRESRRGGRRAGMPNTRLPAVYSSRRSGRAQAPGPPPETLPRAA